MKNPDFLDPQEGHYLLKGNNQKPTANRCKLDGVLTLIGGAFIHLVLGTFYLWGAIAVYVASYLRSMDYTITISDLMRVTPITGVGLNLGFMFGVPLSERFGPRVVLLSSILVISLAVGATSQATTYAGFVGLYGVLNGVATGIAYMTPVVCGWKYFPNNKGLVSGITIGAFGFGSFIFNFVATDIVNPNGLLPTIVDGKFKYFTEEVYERVPGMFKILGVCYFVLGVIGTFLIRVPKEEKSDYVPLEAQEEGIIVPPEEGCSSVKEGVFSRHFLILFTIGSCGITFGLLMANNYKVYGLTQIPNDHFVTVVGSIGSICNGGTRAVWALLFDKFGFKKVYFVLILFQAILSVTLSLISSEKYLYLLWFCLIMGCEGGHFSMLPSVTAKVFGLKFGPKVYGYLFWCFAVAGWFVLGLTNLALNYIGWNATFYLGGGLTLVSFIMNLFVKEKFERKEV